MPAATDRVTADIGSTLPEIVVPLAPGPPLN